MSQLEGFDVCQCAQIQGGPIAPTGLRPHRLEGHQNQTSRLVPQIVPTPRGVRGLGYTASF